MTTIVRNILAFSFILFFSSAHCSDKIRLIGDVNFSTGEKFESTELGGLSGLSYDSKTNKLFSVSDDKSLINEARFYEFEIALTPQSFSVKPTAVIKLKDQNNKTFKKGYADFEGIAIVGDDIFLSTEGAINRQKPIAPELYRFSRKGEFKNLLSIPEKFLLPEKNDPALQTGLRDNRAFEALSASLDGKTLFMAPEEALYQDGPLTDITTSSHVRIIRYKDFKPFSEVAYKLEKVEALKTRDLSPAENGLVDIAAIDEKTFYTLERSYLPFQNKNVVRIFKCAITDKTTEVSSFETLKEAQFSAVEKTLVADLDDFLPLMNPSSLDNLEGISFGPVLPNGNKTLILVSDNNFGKGQRTLFLAFEILSK